MVICDRPVTAKLLVQTPLWSLDIVWCAIKQGTLSFVFTQLKMGTGLHWELTYNKLMCPWLIRLASRKRGISTDLLCLYGTQKDLTLTWPSEMFNCRRWGFVLEVVEKISLLGIRLGCFPFINCSCWTRLIKKELSAMCLFPLSIHLPYRIRRLLNKNHFIENVSAVWRFI